MPFQLGMLELHWYPLEHLPPLDMIIEARTAFGSYLFRPIVITACWIIWNSRNGLILDNKPCTLAMWNVLFKEIIGLICIKAKPNLAGSLKMWLEKLSQCFPFFSFLDLQAPFMHPLCICSYIPLILIQKIGGEIPPRRPIKTRFTRYEKNLIVYVSNIVDLNILYINLTKFLRNLTCDGDKMIYKVKWSD